MHVRPIEVELAVFVVEGLQDSNLNRTNSARLTLDDGHASFAPSLLPASETRGQLLRWPRRK